jgi:hypothetical protein
MTEKEILEIIKKHPEVILEIIYSSSVTTKQDIKILGDYPIYSTYALKFQTSRRRNKV